MVRKINQGLSDRVKTDEAFANTRLNNVEFKHANQLAAIAFNDVPNRKRGMMVNFAIAAMTKRALAAIKEGSGAWGDRRPDIMVDSLMCDMLENHAKGGVYDSEYGNIAITNLSTAGVGKIEFSLSQSLLSSLVNDGVDSLVYVTQICAVGITASGVDTFAFGGRNIYAVEQETLDPTSDLRVEINLNVGSAANLNMRPAEYAVLNTLANHGYYAVVSILPARIQGSQMYTLQEKCTFVAIPLGKIPTT